MAVLVVNKSNFQKEVLESDRTVLLDFWASWCGPCKSFAPIIDEISAEHPEIKVCKVNIDEEQELAEQFNIMSIPTLLVIKEGKVVDQSVGLNSKNQILQML
ncbi:MAG: thioredoxin [Clostridia bacterium]|nr:thioredoxin [Clostridia bacterium]